MRQGFEPVLSSCETPQQTLATSDTLFAMHRNLIGYVLLLALFLCFATASSASAVAVNGAELNKSYKINFSKQATPQAKKAEQQQTAKNPPVRESQKASSTSPDKIPPIKDQEKKHSSGEIKKEKIIQPKHYLGGETLETGSKAPKIPLDFHQCVQMALQQSPFFVDSALQIKVKRINETDSFYNIFPDIMVSTGYIITTPYSDAGEWKINFTTGQYDPISAAFGIKATKLVTQIAILGHMRTIAEGIYKLGKMFIQLNLLDKLAACQDELVAIENHEKNYLKNLLASGASNPLEIRVADQKLAMARLKRDQIEADRNEVMENLKTFLGINPEEDLKLNLQHVKEQLLGRFSPSNVTIADVKANSLKLKIREQVERIKQYDIKIAWARFLPKFIFEMRTIDPIDSDDDHNGLYGTAGLYWTVWDWGERSRNIDKTRSSVKRARVETNLERLQLATDWRLDIARQHRSLAALKVANAQVELAGLQKRQSEISYQAGSQPFPTYLEQIREYFTARKKALYKESEYVQSELDLRELSGHLYQSYINASNF